MLIPIILGSDKTTVSVATSQNEYWPIYLSISNIHNNVCWAHRNGVVLLGFLPIPKGKCYIYLLLLLPPMQSRHQTGHERCRISQLSSSNLPLCHCTNPTTSQSSHDQTHSCSVPQLSLSSCNIQPWSIHWKLSRTSTSFMHCTRMVSKVSPSYNTLHFLHVLY